MPQKHRLRAVRDNDGRTQKQLAADSGISASTISHIECHRGPDVPLGEWRPTRTKLQTIVNLAVALEQLPPGTYDLEEVIVFAREHKIVFAPNEIHEAVRLGLVKPSRRGKARVATRSVKTTRRKGHLGLVANAA